MDEPTGEGSAKEVAAAEPEEKVYTQRAVVDWWDIECRKWKSRIYLLAGAIPASFLSGFFYAHDAIDDVSVGETLILVTLLIMTPLIAMSMFHGFKYSKGTGKWWWI